jgi:DNA-directed RNA polymerase specialized sigma24 family protein
MRDDPSVVALVLRAAEGDQRAWDEIVERYASLVYAICTRYRLGSHDIEDVGQTVWLLLVEHLGQLREPAALPGWLATTTARECVRVVKGASRSEWLGTGQDDSLRFVDDTAIDEEILMAERNEALRALFADSNPHCRLETRIGRLSTSSNDLALSAETYCDWRICAGRMSFVQQCGLRRTGYMVRRPRHLAFGGHDRGGNLWLIESL